MLMFRPLIKYATFSGRARRSEYWLFQLLQVIVYIGLFAMMFAGAIGRTANVASVLTGALTSMGLILLIAAALLVPNLAVTTRRLHDSGRSAWWLLLFVPGILNGFMQAGQVGRMFTDPETFQASAGRSVLLSLIVLGCNLVLLVLMCLPGTRGSNRFGDDPKGGPSLDIARVFDAPDYEPEPTAEAPHKPVFDFGPARGVPAVRETTPGPAYAPAPQQGWGQPAASASRPTFGKRR